MFYDILKNDLNIIKLCGRIPRLYYAKLLFYIVEKNLIMQFDVVLNIFNILAIV